MRSLVIKCTVGAEDPERCNQAFTVAAAGVAVGAQVSLWLTGEAAWFAVPGRAEEFTLPPATPLPAPRGGPPPPRGAASGRPAAGAPPAEAWWPPTSSPTSASPAPPSSAR